MTVAEDVEGRHSTGQNNKYRNIKNENPQEGNGRMVGRIKAGNLMPIWMVKGFGE